MACQKCSSDRVISVQAKCSDCCWVHYKDMESDGYVPHEFGIGGGDYIEIDLCIQCGTVQGEFPLAEPTEWLEEHEEFFKNKTPPNEEW